MFIGDSDRHRVVIYRPNLANNTLDFVSSIEAFGDGLPRSVAIDPATGKLAVSGAYSGSVWVLETPNVAAFNLQVLNAAGAVIDSVCAGDAYKVRFSLTVPAGRTSVTGVVPQLSIDGTAVAVVPIGSGTYGRSEERRVGKECCR